MLKVIPKMRNAIVKSDVYSRASLSDLMNVAPMSAETHAALLRQKTANRRSIEDRRIAAQVMADSFADFDD